MNINQKIFVAFGFLSHALSGMQVMADTLHFDETQIEGSKFQFDNADAVKPEPNDFELLNYSLLSSESGERWAIITIENTSAGRRILKNEHVVATFANGNRSRAISLNERFKPGEVITRAVSFSHHPFPIVSVDVKPE